MDTIKIKKIEAERPKEVNLRIEQFGIESWCDFCGVRGKKCIKGLMCRKEVTASFYGIDMEDLSYTRHIKSPPCLSYSPFLNRYLIKAKDIVYGYFSEKDPRTVLKKIPVEFKPIICTDCIKQIAKQL